MLKDKVQRNKVLMVITTCAALQLLSNLQLAAEQKYTAVPYSCRSWQTLTLIQLRRILTLWMHTWSGETTINISAAVFGECLPWLCHKHQHTAYEHIHFLSVIQRWQLIAWQRPWVSRSGNKALSFLFWAEKNWRFGKKEWCHGRKKKEKTRTQDSILCLQGQK